MPILKLEIFQNSKSQKCKICCTRQINDPLNHNFIVQAPQSPPGTPKHPKPNLCNYPSQTPSVIYFWNPWDQTSNLLHSDHYLGPPRPPKWGAFLWVSFIAIF